MTDMHKAPSVALDRASDRQPIFSALNVLGLKDAATARLLGVAAVPVHLWATGKQPVPLVRHLALLFVVGRLTGLIGAKYPLNSRHARRAQIAIDAATAWAKLARDELDEDAGGVLDDVALIRGYELGERILARMEAQ
jgi:hypothetical protein